MEPERRSRGGAGKSPIKDLTRPEDNQSGFENGQKAIESSGNVPTPKKRKADGWSKPGESAGSISGICPAPEGGAPRLKKENASSCPVRNNDSSGGHRESLLKCSPNTSPKCSEASTSLNVSFQHLPSPRVTRQSWRRNSLKQDGNRRRSLPPLQADITELSKAIGLDLPDGDRMAALLLSAFQYSAQKLKHSLSLDEGFNPAAFDLQVKSLSEELQYCTKRLKLDGTLQKCFEDPESASSDPTLNAAIAELKGCIARISAEDRAWDQLLLSHQQSAEGKSRQLQRCQSNRTAEEELGSLRTSQAEVLQSKPDYQKMVDSQAEVFNSMELALDEIHQVMKVCSAFSEDVFQCLTKESLQLASKTFRRIENSPVRKLLRPTPTKAPTAEPPEGERPLSEMQNPI